MIIKAFIPLAAVAVAAALAACYPDAAAQTEHGRAGPEIPRLGDRPDFNGVWQAIRTAHWNLEDHSAAGLDEFWQRGAIGAVPVSARPRR